MAIKIDQTCWVTIAYRISDLEGRLLEERTPEHPYEYLQGSGQINGPVERALEGKTAGYRTEITVTPRDSYGEYDATLVAEVPLSNFPPHTDPQVGMKFNTTASDGATLTVRVIEVTEDSVTVDGNHPLAGLELVFSVQVLDVREASKSELGEEDETGASGGIRGGSGTMH